jgi:hypothetical protein
MWEDLDLLLHQHGRKIRSIWIADIANQGASGLLNEDSKYDDGRVIPFIDFEHLFTPMSLLVGSSTRPAQHDQPLSFRDDSTYYRHGSLNGWNSIVRSAPSLAPIHAKTNLGSCSLLPTQHYSHPLFYWIRSLHQMK